MTTKKRGLWAVVVMTIFGLASNGLAASGGQVTTPSERAAKERPSEAREAASVSAAPTCALAIDGRYPGVYREDPWEAGEIALTFDDGPYPGATRKILDLLQKKEFPATFFVVGAAIHAGTYPLIRRMIAEGHDVGTHTFHHDLNMTTRGWGADYVAGQYALTHVSIELALLAESPEDFEAMMLRVFERKRGNEVSATAVRDQWHTYVERHAALLGERGWRDGARPYPLLFARPPGGIPYLGNWKDDAFRALHEEALAGLGLLNVLWHGGSGDTDPDKRNDFSFLTSSVNYHSKKGGVLLVHDRMRFDALEASFDRIARNDELRVVPLRVGLERKYGCDLATLGRAVAAR